MAIFHSAGSLSPILPLWLCDFFVAWEMGRAENWMIYVHKLNLLVIVLVKWDLAHLTLSVMVNASVLVLWRYLTFAAKGQFFCFEQVIFDSVQYEHAGCIYCRWILVVNRYIVTFVYYFSPSTWTKMSDMLPQWWTNIW